VYNTALLLDVLRALREGQTELATAKLLLLLAYRDQLGRSLDPEFAFSITLCPRPGAARRQDFLTKVPASTTLPASPPDRSTGELMREFSDLVPLTHVAASLKEFNAFSGLAEARGKMARAAPTKRK